MADDGLSQLTDDEKTALLALLKRTINDDRYPLSPRIGMLRGILARRAGQTAKLPGPPNYCAVLCDPVQAAPTALCSRNLSSLTSDGVVFWRYLGSVDLDPRLPPGTLLYLSGGPWVHLSVSGCARPKVIRVLEFHSSSI